MNSITISNKDDKEKRLMVIGEYQVPERQAGIVYLTLCHHPPECWKDPDNIIANKLNKRVAVQLYGHKHIQDIKKIDNSLIIGSGATHPDRGEPDWTPRYNWITVNIEIINNDSFLNVKIYPRILNQKGDRFETDYEICKEKEYVPYLLKLNNEVDQENTSKEILLNSKGHKEDIQIETNVKQINIDTKTLVYRFLEIPYIKRSSILLKLDLVDETDEGINHVEIITKILRKAEESGCLEEFWKEVSKY